ncbi:FecR domain-containing protein [Parasphingorhabdus sp. JC815]|uniref:FecR family protein n=1 Tax=Parasphingorhabdus sp. JC815 TaxID=3232140 RepID=UPI0034592A7B
MGDDHIEYIIKRGDTLVDLAQKYLRGHNDYITVQRINRIDSPRLLPIGKKIAIPFNLLKYRPSEASLAAYRGKISIGHEGRTIKPVAGMNIPEGSVLATSSGSFLALQLEDGSRISMPSNSKMRITRLRHILLTDSVDYELAVDRGRLRSKVAPFDKGSDRYRVRTPVAVSAVRGTDYRTRVDENSGTVYSETVEGVVDVAAGETFSDSGAVSIPAGTGAAANASGELYKADLLTPPQLLEPAKVQSEDMLEFAVEPRGAATAHRILISTDAGFVDVIAEQLENGEKIQLPGIADGQYFAKITAFGPNGFEGMPASYSFKRQLSTLSGSAVKDDFGYRFKWAGAGKGKRVYRFQLFLNDENSIPVVDEAGLSSETITLSDLPDGTYYWRVGVTQYSPDPEEEAFQKWTDFEKLIVAG